MPDGKDGQRDAVLFPNCRRTEREKVLVNSAPTARPTFDELAQRENSGQCSGSGDELAAADAVSLFMGLLPPSRRSLFCALAAHRIATAWRIRKPAPSSRSEKRDSRKRGQRASEPMSTTYPRRVFAGTA